MVDTLPRPGSGTALSRPARAGRLDAWLVGLVAVALACSCALDWGSLRSPTTTWAGGGGDQEQMIWFVGWTAHALTHGLNPLVTDVSLYPQPVNLMWNTSILLPSALLTPLTVVGGPVLSFNVLMLLAPVGAAATAYTAFRRYVAHRGAAAVGALAFGFCPLSVRQAAAGHPQVAVVALLPVLLLALDEILVRQRWRARSAGLLLGGAAAAQLLTGEELLLVAALAAGVAVAALAVVDRRAVRARAAYALRAGGVAAAVFGLVAAGPLLEQVLGPGRPTGTFHDPSVFVVDLANLVRPVGQRFGLGLGSAGMPFTGNAGEWTGFLGVPLLAVVAWTVARRVRSRRVVAVAALLFAVFGLCSLGPTLHVDGRSVVPLPWTLLRGLPLLDQVLPARVAVVVDLAATLLLAVFVDGLADVAGGPRRLAGAALVVAVGVTWVPAPASVGSAPIPRLFTSAGLDRIPAGSVALVAPYPVGEADQALVWQSVAGMRFAMLDGYLIVPGSHQGPDTVLARTLVRLETSTAPVAVTVRSRTALLGQLRRDRVDEVLVGPAPSESATVRLFTSVFGRAPDLDEGGLEVWWTSGTP